MSFVHGKNTYISINAKDLSTYTKSSELERSADSHDNTTYGKNSHVYGGGLLDASFKAEGVYDSTASTGPRAVLQPIVGTVVELIRRPEGTGTGKPEETVDVLITKYTETNPVDDMIKWAVEGQCSDDIATTTQA